MVLASGGPTLELAGAQATTAQTAKDSYTPAPENLKARTSFQDAKFGCSFMGSVQRARRPAKWLWRRGRSIERITEGARRFFIPIKFDPAAWVGAGKSRGMKYITITSKLMMDSRCLIRA